jgi:hypothetical protein
MFTGGDRDGQPSPNMITIYINEAHAANTWPLGSDVSVNNTHVTIQDRLNCCNDFIELVDWTIPTFIDNETNQFEKSFFSWPDRSYVVDFVEQNPTKWNADFDREREAFTLKFIALPGGMGRRFQNWPETITAFLESGERSGH